MLNTFLIYTYLFLFSSVVSSYSGLFFILFCTVTFTRFTISRHTLPPIEVDYSDSHNSQLDMVHKQACMVVHMPCNCTVVFGRQLCNYSGSSAGGLLVITGRNRLSTSFHPQSTVFMSPSFPIHTMIWK